MARVFSVRFLPYPLCPITYTLLLRTLHQYVDPSEEFTPGFEASLSQPLVDRTDVGRVCVPLVNQLHLTLARVVPDLVDERQPCC